MIKYEDYNWSYTDECLLEDYKESFLRIKKKNKNLKTVTCENCHFLPLKNVLNYWTFFEGGVFDSNFKFIEEAKLLPNRVFYSYRFDKENFYYDNREVIFAGYFWDHWGHFILEQISRLWYFLNEKDSTLPIVYMGNKPLEGNYLEFFELLGIDTKRLIFVEKPTKFKKVHIPEVSMVAMSYFTDEYSKIFEKVRSSVIKDENYPKKIFFTRRNFPRSKNTDFGAIKEVESFFESNCYTFISPEKLTLKEQVKYLKSCDEYVCVSGTLPHNILFAEKNIKSIVLNKSYIINPHQPLIEMATGIKTTYIDTHLSLLRQHIGRGPFYFSFTDNLENWAKDNNLAYTPCSNEKYLKDFFIHYLRVMPETIKIYAMNQINIKLRTYYLNKTKHKFLIKFALFLIALILTPRALYSKKLKPYRLLSLVLATKIKLAI